MGGKSKEIILRPQAQQDLDAIRLKYPQVTEDILSKIELLLEFPEMGPRMDRAYQGFRQILCGSYRIIYEVSSQRIEIAYIRHCSRQMALRLLYP